MDVWMLTAVQTPKVSVDISPTLETTMWKHTPLVVWDEENTGGPTPWMCIEGNGMRPSHLGVGMSVNTPMYTLNTTEVHAVMMEEDDVDRQASEHGD